METWQKIAAGVAVLALAGGAGRHAEDARTDPTRIYGPAEIGDDVGRGLDRATGGIGDAAGGAIGKSRVAQGAAVGAGAYGAGKAWKKWGGGRSKDDPVPVPDDAATPTLPTLVPVPGVNG